MSEKKINLKIVIAILLTVLVLGGGITYVVPCLSGIAKLKNTMVAGDKTYSTIIYREDTYTYNKDLINILCLGIDKHEQLGERDIYADSLGQADVIIVASINTKTHEINMVSVPRDTVTLVEECSEDGKLLDILERQITLQYAYGDGKELSATLMSKRVSELMLNIPINGYVAINFEALKAINDVVGGVDIVMDEDYTKFDDTFVKGETVHLEGNDALWYIRARDKEELDSSYTRINRTKQYIMAFAEKAKAVAKEDLTILTDLVTELAPYMETSLDGDEILCLAKEALKCDFSEIGMYTLPGEVDPGVIWTEFHLDHDKVAELTVDLFYEED